MSDSFQYLDSLKDAIKELGKFAPDLNEAIKKGEKQKVLVKVLVKV